MPALSGIAKNQLGELSQKLLRAYRFDSGVLVGQAVSDETTGAWSITTLDTSYHFLVEHDGVVDKYWPETSILCPFNGANGAISFTDATGKVFTGVGGAQISTSAAKFGASSALLDGTDDYFTTPNHADFEFGSGSATVEGFFRFDSAQGSVKTIVGRDDIGGTRGFLIQASSSFIYGEMYLTGGFTANAGGSFTFTNGVWYHFAFVRNGGSFRFYINGVALANVTNSRPEAAISNSHALSIGSSKASGSYANFFNGRIDSLRISRIARYTTDFTAPSLEFIGAPTGGTQNAAIIDLLTPV